MSDFSYIAGNLTAIRDEIESLCAREGVPCPKLLAVTKSAEDDEVIALSKMGIDMVGENRVQNFRHRREILSDSGYTGEYHLIGSLQKNKVKYLIGECDLIHSVDSVELARKISDVSTSRGANTNILIEVNSGREEAKGGLFPEAFADALSEIASLPSLSVRGVMTMAPICESDLEYAKYFRETYKLFDDARSAGYFGETPVLSMGMSGSYRAAICEGSTLVRIGRSLFIK